MKKLIEVFSKTKHRQQLMYPLLMSQVACQKIILIIVMCFIYITSFAQPYIGMLATNKGVGFQIGVLSESGGLELSAASNMPLLSNTTPTILSINIGKQFLLTKNDDDNYSITPSVGFSSYNYKNFTEYDKIPRGDIIQVSEIKPIYRIEIGKDSYLGRVFVSANYCKGFYYGVGMKFFFYR